MRNLAIGIAGFLAGAVVILSVALALPQHTSVTVKTVSPQAAVPIRMMSGARGMMNGSGNGMMMASAVTAAAPTVRKLTIQHVQRGCHVWSNGTTTGPMMRLHMRPGQRLAILDEDVDPHQLLQVPARCTCGWAGR
jgi:hypothetical protein